MIAQTLSWLKGHPDHLDELTFCAINVSGASLADTAFAEFVGDQVGLTGVPPAKVCFELTETVAIRNLDAARRFIETLKDCGCRFALDDFGQGMASFAYLKSLPVDIVKIDGSFVRGIVDNLCDHSIVKAIAEIGRGMGKQTVAEGVESDAVLAAVKTLGIEYAQGFHISRPRPLEELFSNVQPLRLPAAG